MKNHFNSLAVFSRAFAGSVLMSWGVQAQEVPAYETLNPEMARTILSAKIEVTEVRDAFARIPLGETMLAAIEKRGITVQCDDKATRNVRYDADKKQIILRSSDMMGYLLSDLAYGIRLAQQHDVIGTGEMKNRFLRPSQRWVLGKYEQADAFSFSAYYIASYAALHPGNHDLTASRNAHFRYVAGLLADDIRRTGKLSAETYREKVFTKMMSFIGGDYHEWESRYPGNDQRLSYNYSTRYDLDIRYDISSFHADMNAAISKAAAGPLTRQSVNEMTVYKKMFDNSPSDEEFEGFIRKFGGLDVAAKGPTCLQDRNAVGTETLMADWPLLFNHTQEDEAKVVKELSAYLKGEQQNFINAISTVSGFYTRMQKAAGMKVK